MCGSIDVKDGCSSKRFGSTVNALKYLLSQKASIVI
jgi:hypothetical protein